MPEERSMLVKTNMSDFSGPLLPRRGQSQACRLQHRGLSNSEYKPGFHHFRSD